MFGSGFGLVLAGFGLVLDWTIIEFGLEFDIIKIEFKFNLIQDESGLQRSIFDFVSY